MRITQRQRLLPLAALCLTFASVGCVSNPPIVDAAKSDNIDGVKAFVATGATLDTKGRNNYTSLHWAANNGNVEMGKLLLDHGATVDARDAAGETPLIVALQNNRWDMVPLLLSYHADPNAKDHNEWSALMWAARNGDVGSCKQLVEAGADIKWETGKTKESAISLALSKSQYDVVQYLAAVNKAGAPTTLPTGAGIAQNPLTTVPPHGDASANAGPNSSTPITKSLSVSPSTQPASTGKRSIVPDE